MVFYIGSVFIVGLIVRADDPELIAVTKQSTSAAASPFVLAIERAQIRALPDIINGCLLLFVMSGAFRQTDSKMSVRLAFVSSGKLRPVHR